MKKFIIFTLVIALTFSLVACGAKNDSADVMSKSNGKKVLTLACFTLSPELEGAIKNFNKNNSDYYVEIKDYGKYDTKDDLEAGEKKLKTDILGGKTPDIIELGMEPIEVYSKKGLLEDLNTFLQKDEKINKNSLLPVAYKALEKNGKLYHITPSFTITSLYGLKSKIGDKDRWNSEELNQFLSKYQEAEAPFINMGQEEILQSMTMYTMSEFIEMDKGKSNFDSEQFVKLLEIAEEASKKTQSEYKEASEELLGNRGLLSIGYLASADNFAQLDNKINNDSNFVGFPTIEGSGNVASFQFSFGILSDSKNKQGAWEFVRSLLEEDFQKKVAEFENPVNLSVYNKKMETSTATEVQKAEYTKIINNIDKAELYEGNIMKIIGEETTAFFEGNRTAEEAAKAIQSRINIYI